MGIPNRTARPPKKVPGGSQEHLEAAPAGPQTPPRQVSAARSENTRPKTNQEVTDPKASSASGSIWRASALSGGVLEEVQEGKRPSEGSPRGLRMTVEGVLRRKGQNPDLYNTSKLISPFVMWEGPSKSRVARTNRPNHMGGNANPGQIKHFVPEVLHF